MQSPDRLLAPVTFVLTSRPRVDSKFLSANGSRHHVRGVTYGAFRPDENGDEYTDLATIDRDFAQMASSGINTVRIPHTMPPRSLLDIAQRHGLFVMVGLSAEQFVGYLTDRKDAPDVLARVRARVRGVAAHPALLCYSLGNEIPAATVRWLGHRRVERYLRQLYDAVKAEDPEGLVTYVNYPSTEYLRLPFLDLVCFNVYLESQEQLEAYLPQLHNIAGDRPLILSEVGLDSLRHGEDKQAQVLDWQLRTIFQAGCAGAVVFAWTDDWYRGVTPVEDWAFGLTDRERHPKPALTAVREAFERAGSLQERDWPRISVIVCSHNGARTLAECFAALRLLEYPNYEVIVVNDGSSDATERLAQEAGFRVISTPNMGLGNARNAGMQAASGEILAYIDDDAYPDPGWLRSLAVTFAQRDFAAVGGPNIAPPTDGFVAACVANAPGNALHVLISDQEAEHIPGCNMAIRKACLEAIGGFDPQFRVAGDDVDVCWRLRQQGWKLGYNATAIVWHHRRNSIGRYWKQQIGYGKSEALLARKWPEKYNEEGHISWRGRVYGQGATESLGFRRQRIYYGVWGSAPFQSIYSVPSDGWMALALMPEWYLVIALLGVLSTLGLLWTPLRLAWPMLAFAVGALFSQAALGAAKSRFPSRPRSRFERFKLQSMVAFLYLLQPLARLRGRLQYDTTFKSPRSVLIFPFPRRLAIWTENGRPAGERLSILDRTLHEPGVVVRQGNEFSRWDLEVWVGALGSARLLMAVEEFGGGKQYVRLRVSPHWTGPTVGVMLLVLALATGAGLDGAWIVTLILGLVVTLLVLQMVRGASTAMGVLLRAIGDTQAIESA